MRFSIIFFSLLFNTTTALGIFEYITAFWPKSQATEPTNTKPLTDDVPKILYEVTPHEATFLEEALSLSGTKSLTNLDRCQHRVVLKLRKNCREMNEEELGKLSVMLLNCQRLVEGKSLVECTEIMSFRDCTSSLDSEIYNSYQIMFTRAKAICIAIGQLQYRQWAENAVNKLTNYAQEQLQVSNLLLEAQKNLQDNIENSNQQIIKNEKDILTLIDFIRAKYTASVKEVSRENLITHEMQIKKFNTLMKEFNNLSNKMAQTKTILDADLRELHENALKIDHDITAANTNLLNQMQEISAQYNENLNVLIEIQSTIQQLFLIINQWREEFRQSSGWLSDNLGGISILKGSFHCVFLFIGMIVLSFIQVDSLSRIIFVTIVIGNALSDLYGNSGLSTHVLIGTLGCLIGMKYLISYIKWREIFHTTTADNIENERNDRRSETPHRQNSQDFHFTCTAIDSQGNICQNPTSKNGIYCHIHSLRRKYER